MRWVKKGLIFTSGKHEWMKTHAQNPYAEHIQDDVFRVHFAGRNADNCAQGGFFDIDINRPNETLCFSKTPSLSFGELGCFDDCGAMPSCIVNFEDKKFMYYTGWTQHRATPFSFFIGLAVSEDDGKTYQRYSQAPVLGRNHHDPYLSCSPYVVIENDVWRMWYVSGTGWGGTYQFADINDAPVKTKHYYHIRHAYSTDGINWKTDGTVCIDYEDDEYAIARPILLKESDIYEMWYCYRGGCDTYRAGYAESSDGLIWNRKDDKVGIDISEGSSFDSEMICYPCVFKHKDKRYMLYNGNNYGAQGVAFATEE